MPARPPALTEAFLGEDGIVDKFIGDAVMVFWNARNARPDRVERACRVDLAGKVASKQLDVQFEAEGLQAFFTHFGIHVGDAVIGNRGSSERMNYTAVASAVNLGSCLECLNKQYGNAILAGDTVYRRSQQDFRFKEIAAVVAKGMTSETIVHELIGVLP